MRLATYRPADGGVRFVVLREDRLHAFTDLDPGTPTRHSAT